MPGGLLDKIFPLQLTKRFFISIVTMIIIFFVGMSVLFIQNLLELEKQSRGKQLNAIARQLDLRMIYSYEDILKQQGALKKPVAEQVKILNSLLQPVVNGLSSSHPGIGMGYYSIELDHVIAIAPDFSPSYLQPVPHSYPYFNVYKTGKPELSLHHTSIAWLGKPILYQTYPLYRDGKLIGHTWANMKMDDFYVTALSGARDTFIVGMFMLVLVIFLSWNIFRRMLLELERFSHAVVEDNINLKTGLLPELQTLLDLVRMRTRELQFSKEELVAANEELAMTNEELADTNYELHKEIVARQLAEKELKKTNEKLLKLALIVESSDDAIISKTLEGIISSWNNGAEQIYGYSAGEAVGKHISILVPPENAGEISSIIEKVQKGERVQHYETTRLRKDGSRFHVSISVSPVKDFEGRIIGASTIARDITQRKLMEDALRSSEERFAKIFEYSPAIISIQSLEEEKYVEVNKRFEELTGYGREEVIGRTPVELDIWKNNRNAKDVLGNLHKGLRVEYEGESLNKKGESAYLSVLVDVIYINGVKHILTVAMDLTEKNKMQAEMNRLDRLNLIGQMAAGIGHEIRNPMTAARGFLQLLMGKQDCKQYREYFNLMIGELDRANQIITEYLSLARNKPSEMEMQNITSIVRALSPLISSDAMNSSKDILFELEDVPDIMLNQKEIRQLILNLTRNGLEAMQRGGKLTIRTYRKAGEVVLAVQDQGKGIDPAVLEKIGTPFITTKENGTGLGLATCYSVAARNNARISIDTGPEGTTFYVGFNS